MLLDVASNELQRQWTLDTGFRFWQYLYGVRAFVPERSSDSCTTKEGCFGQLLNINNKEKTKGCLRAFCLTIV